MKKCDNGDKKCETGGKDMISLFVSVLFVGWVGLGWVGWIGCL